MQKYDVRIINSYGNLGNRGTVSAENYDSAMRSVCRNLSTMPIFKLTDVEIPLELQEQPTYVEYMTQPLERGMMLRLQQHFMKNHGWLAAALYIIKGARKEVWYIEIQDSDVFEQDVKGAIPTYSVKEGKVVG